MGKRVKTYRSSKELSKIFTDLIGESFDLDCGHKLTISNNMKNALVVYTEGSENKTCCGNCYF